MAISKDEILETISNMTVLEIVDLISAMEKKFNVTAQAPIAMALPAAGATPAAAVEEKTEFTVQLTSFGANKVNVIKVVRTLTGLGLTPNDGEYGVFDHILVAPTIEDLDKAKP